MTTFDSPTESAAQDGLAPAVARSAQVERELTCNSARFRVLTGDRPTGPLHLGHYLGTLRNRVRLQDLGVQVLLVVADYQVSTARDGTAAIAGNVLELMADHLSTGIEPAVTTIFAHSAVPALNQLVLPFLSLISDAELRRNPTVKAGLAATRSRGLSGLLLTYPVHQAADILFCGGNLVPVGRDQLPHLETTRLVARRFNDRYDSGRTVFQEPDALLSEVPLLLGTDGVKMSKSRGNTIGLGDSAERTAALIHGARTDSERTITYEPMRRPEVASLLHIAAMCSGTQPGLIAEKIGNGGAGELKRVVTESVNEHLRPLRVRRRELAPDPGYLLDVLRAGNARANEIADHTLDEVRAVMGMKYCTPTTPSAPDIDRHAGGGAPHHSRQARGEQHGAEIRSPQGRKATRIGRVTEHPDPWPLRHLVLRTPRLELRLDDDAELLDLVKLAHEGIHDPSWTPFLHPWAEAPAAELGPNTMRFFWLQRASLTPERWTINFLIRVDGRVVGTQGFTGGHFATMREVVSGSWLGRAHQGQGFGEEMRAAVLMLAFDHLDARTARSEAFVDNSASLRVSEKLGYTADGTNTQLRRGETVAEQRVLLTPASFVRPTWKLEVDGFDGCKHQLGA